MSRNLAGIAVRSQHILVDSMRRHMESRALPEADPLYVSKAFIQMTGQMMANPVHMVKSNLNLWQNYPALWNNSTQRMLGQDTAPIIEPTSDASTTTLEMKTKSSISSSNPNYSRRGGFRPP